MSCSARAFVCGVDAGIQQALEQAGDQRGAGDAQVAGLFVDRRVQAGSGLGVETDVGPVGGKRRDPRRPLAQLDRGRRGPGSAIGRRPAVRPATPAGSRGSRSRSRSARRCGPRRSRASPGRSARTSRPARRPSSRGTARAGIASASADRQFPVGGTVVGGDPHDATRHRGGPADGRGLLEDLHRGAGDRRGQCGCERGAAAAEHDDIDFMVPRHGLLSLQLS